MLQVQSSLSYNLLLSSRQEKLKFSIIKTLAYSAIFNFPLTSKEVYKYLISDNSVVMPFTFPTGRQVASQIYNAMNCITTRWMLDSLKEKGLICEKKGYYFPRGMESGIKQRIKRRKVAQKKFSIARKFCRIAKYIPTIKLIGISGALAMNNAHEEDDIDLFVVAQSGTVWITRFLTVLLAEILGVRRRPEDGDSLSSPAFEKNVKDKICLNMFIDEENMRIPENERDLFSAHEVVQMKPIYDKDDTYSLFIKKNEWAKGYMPNAIDAGFKNQELRIKNLRVTCYVLRVTAFIEQLVKRIQLNYMQYKRTNEVIKDGYLRFHPVDARRLVLRRYGQILQKVTKLYP